MRTSLQAACFTFPKQKTDSHELNAKETENFGKQRNFFQMQIVPIMTSSPIKKGRRKEKPETITKTIAPKVALLRKKGERAKEIRAQMQAIVVAHVVG